MCSHFGLKLVVALAAVYPTFALNYNVSLNSQTRMAYHGPTGMTISWNTYNQLSNPTVKYGLSPDALTMTASSSTSVTYATSLTYNNHVVLSNLLPNTVYYYKPQQMMQNDSSAAPYSFKTAITKGDTRPYSVAVVVDMGTFGPEGLGTTAGAGVSPNNILKPGEQNTIQSISKVINDFEFLMHPGDIAYADTWLTEAKAGYINASQTYAQGYKAYESILNDFYDQMTPITTRIPYLVGPGNHEANCDNGKNLSLCMPGQTNFTGFRNHFRMPSDVSGGLENFWYSYDAGMVHYIQIDTETDLGHSLTGPSEGDPEQSGPFGLMNQQINWLQNDLASVDRSITPWIVVAGHRPWYSSGSICSNCQKAFEPLFLQYGIDLYLSGHFHVYERNTPIANNVSDPRGLNNPSAPWYITNGAAGHYDGLDSFTLPLMPYQVVGYSTADGIYGWSKLDFHNCTHMTQSFIASNNGSVLDSATLFKNRVCGKGAVSSSSDFVSMTTSIVYATSIYTITQCSSTVTNCPASSTKVTTVISTLYTTVCPVSPTSTSQAMTRASSIPTSPASGSARATTPAVSPITSTASVTTVSTSRFTGGAAATGVSGLMAGGIVLFWGLF